MRLRHVGLALLLSALAGATPSTAAQPTSEVVFTRHVQGTGRSDVYVVNADGSGLRRLTRDGTSGAAVYSPDGRRVAFASGRAHGAHAPELYVMDADGSDVRRLTRTYRGRRAFSRNTEPAWSPDGATIVYVRTDVRRGKETTDLWRVRADGSGSPVRLTRHPGRESSPTFAPNGMLGFEREGSIVGLWQGRVFNVRPGTDPAWSPDNTYLAFVADGGIHLTLGQSSRRIAAGTFPAWSPDGTRLAYRSPGGRLEVVTILGLATQRITTGARATEDIYPSWRP